MKLKATETEVVKSCLQVLWAKHIFAKRINTMGVYDLKTGQYHLNPHTPKGMSDILAVWEGHAIFIECKSGKNKQSDNQKDFEEEVKRAGGMYIVVHDIDELVDKLDFIFYSEHMLKGVDLKN